MPEVKVTGENKSSLQMAHRGWKPDLNWKL